METRRQRLVHTKCAMQISYRIFSEIQAQDHFCPTALKYKYGNRKFWSEGYFISTVGLNEVTIRKYIREQEKHDLMQDKLRVREHQDPFKG